MSSAGEKEGGAGRPRGGGRDKTYKHAFKGSVLINTLMEYDKDRFSDREAAAAFGQRLLDMRHVESVVGSGAGATVFEDGAALYRWCDETLVKQAKKMVTTTSSHIPKRRLIELLDLNHGGDEAYDLGEMRARVVGRLDTATMEHLQQGDGEADASQDVPRRSRRKLDLSERLLRSTSEDGTDSVQQEPEQPEDEDYGSAGEQDRLHASPEEDDAVSCKNYSMDDGLDSDNTPQFTDLGSSTTPSDLESPFVESESPVNFTPETASITSSEMETRDTRVVEQVNLAALRQKEEEALADLQEMQLSLKEAENADAFVALKKNLASLSAESSGFSDNEKQLLEEMKRMQQEHLSVVKSYEDRISELMGTVQGLRSMADVLEGQQQQDAAGQTAVAETSDATSVPAAPALPTPAPPPVNPMTLLLPRLAQPNKPAVKPRVKMRPLFWNRIIVEDKDKGNKQPNTFWKKLTEPNFDVDEFEELFGKDPAKEKANARSLHDAMSPRRTGTSMGNRVKTVKILEDSRSRAIGIKLMSMHCQMADIKEAVFDLNFDTIDEESLFGLYELRGNSEEIAKIEAHRKENKNAVLDQPEQFLHEVSQMCHFEERVECLLLRKRFNESMFNIDEQLNTLLYVCDDLRTNEHLKTLMETVLAFGNYMNGGTQRGQADGFDINILTRLKDVKSMDNSLTLLQFIVRAHTREHEDDAGQNEAKFRLPAPALMQQAAQCSLIDLDKELKALQKQVQEHLKKAQKVYHNSEPRLLQPFKDCMEDFFESAEQILRRTNTKCEEAKSQFAYVVDYFCARNILEKVTSDAFFSIWHQFLSDYHTLWQTEQKRIAKEMFAKIEKRKKERRQRAQRRRSIVEEGKSNLKQKFAQMRRRSITSGVPAHAAALIRSHSVSSIDTLSSQSSLERSMERKRTRQRSSRGDDHNTDRRSARDDDQATDSRAIRENRRSREERKMLKDERAMIENKSSQIDSQVSRDDDSVFGDDAGKKVERRSASEAQPRRRRTLAEPPSQSEVTQPDLEKSISVDESRLITSSNVPSRLTSLGENNMRLKYYYRTNELNKDADANKDKDEKVKEAKKEERQRHRFAPETVTKTGESMIERMQRNRRGDKGSSTESDNNQVAEKSKMDVQRSALEERIERRRRSRTEVISPTRSGPPLMDTSASRRRSRSNMFSDTESEISVADQVPGHLRRSRTLLSDTDSESSKTLVNMPTHVRRSRTNLLADSTIESTTTTGESRSSGYMRRSRTNLHEDTKNEGYVQSNLKQMPSQLRRSRAGALDDVGKVEADVSNAPLYTRRSRLSLAEPVQNNVLSSSENGFENRVRTRRSSHNELTQSPVSKPVASADEKNKDELSQDPSSQVRRRLPLEPRSRASLVLPDSKTEESNASKWIRAKVFDSIKDTVNSASAGISALAQRFDKSIVQGVADNKGQCVPESKQTMDYNHNHLHNAKSNIEEKSQQNGPLSPSCKGVENSTNNHMSSNGAVNNSSSVAARIRLRRLSSNDPPSNQHQTSNSIVQEKSRMLAQRTNSYEPRIRSRLSSAQSMEALHKPVHSMNSGARVRDRMSSFESGQSGDFKGRGSRSSSPGAPAPMRMRSRAGSELNLTQSHDGAPGGGVPSENKVSDKEALSQRDYRDVLRKLSRSNSSVVTTYTR